MLRSIDFKTMPYLFTDKAGTCLTVEFDGRELDDIYKQVKTMYDQAHPSHPSDDMPTEPGWYATRDGEDLLSYDGDAWHIHNIDKNAVAISYKDNRLILTVDDAQALLRQLEMLLPERPSRDEPEEPGFYRTRTGAFLRKNKNGAWSALFINGDLIPRYWNDQDDYAKWRTVLECLYPRAFPLTPTTAPYPLKG